MLIGGGHGLVAAQALGLPGGRNIPKWINDTLAKSSPNRREAGAPDLQRGQQAAIADGQCLVYVDRTLEKGNDAIAVAVASAKRKLLCAFGKLFLQSNYHYCWSLTQGRRTRADRRVTVGADKGYDTRGFVKACREMKVTPHVARNTRRIGGSAIDARTTRHGGYAVSQRRRKCIEQCFGWGKAIGQIRQVMVRGLEKVGQLFTLTMAAYNLTRLRSLAALRPQMV